MRLASRIALALLSVSVVSVVLIGKCGLQLEEELRTVNAPPGPMAPDALLPSTYQPAYGDEDEQPQRSREDEYRLEIQRLQNEVADLRRRLDAVRHLQDDGIRPIPVRSVDPPDANEEDCSEFVERQVIAAEIGSGAALNNEYEVLPFSHFTFSRVYPAELGFGKRVVEKPIGYRRKDLLEVLVRALEVLNKDRQGGRRYSVEDFVEGMYRNDPTTGTQYSLHFRERNTSSRIYRTLNMVRPFAPVRLLKNEPWRTGKQLVNVILPLSGRIDTFRSFMDKFARVGIRHDRRVFLTVVYFGAQGLSGVQKVLTGVARDTRFRNFKLLALNDTFSRGKGLRVGAQHWSKGDVLLFLCDVDVVFSTKFLERCRLHATPGRSVYYPIVFSLYNPRVVYQLQGRVIPPQAEQLLISRDTGFWRDFGFGMSCQWRSDFLALKGFEDELAGWGGEDVLLYRKYVRSRLKVVRATDPGIFHMWHEKRCDGQALAADQRLACLRSRALSEASHAQMGLLAFREELEEHRSSNSSAT